MKKVSLPPGIKDYTPEIVNKFEYINDIFFQEAESWGFNKIYTPLIENIDSLVSDSRDIDNKNILKLIDPTTGGILGIKSDVTPQIARFITSNYSSSELPIRLSYAERVIRNKLNIQTDSREVFQLGCESIGTDGIFNDIEIIQLASSLLKKMGFTEQVITLSSSLVVNFILSRLKVSGDEIKNLFYKKNFSDIIKISQDNSFPKGERSFIKSFVIPFTKNKIPNSKLINSDIKKEVNNLQTIKNNLIQINSEVKCEIDYLDVKDFNYYSNITFQINSPVAKSPLINGGRYNNLFNDYEMSIPAIGFGLDLLSVVKNIKIDDSLQPKAIIIINSENNMAEFFKIRDFLANQGFIVSFSKNKSTNQTGQIVIKLDKNKQVFLFDGEMNRIAKFKSISEFIEEEI